MRAPHTLDAVLAAQPGSYVPQSTDRTRPKAGTKSPAFSNSCGKTVRDLRLGSCSFGQKTSTTKCNSVARNERGGETAELKRQVTASRIATPRSGPTMCFVFWNSATVRQFLSALLLQNRAVSVPDQLGPHSLCVFDVRERSQLHTKQLVRCWRRNECRIFFFLQRID